MQRRVQIAWDISARWRIRKRRRSLAPALAVFELPSKMRPVTRDDYANGVHICTRPVYDITIFEHV